MQKQEQSRGVVYIDSLGISWTQEELDDVQEKQRPGSDNDII